MPVSPLIQNAIPLRNIELCRNRIAEIILAELDYQYQNNYNPDAQIDEVYIERTNPTDFIETSCVNVSIDTNTFSNKTYAGSKTSVASINIDVYVKSETTETERGDSASRLKCTRLLSMIEYMLDDPQYKTLGFPNTFINTLSVDSYGMADPEKYDTQNITQGRVVFTATVTENNELIDAPYLESSITQSLIGLSGKGLRYVNGQDGPNPPLNPNFVYIRDTGTGNIIALAKGGTIYDVTVLRRLIDTILNNQITIVDNIINNG